MNETQTSAGAPGDPHEARASALFSQLVIQQINLALMFLGKTPHPVSGESMFDLDSAQLIIDQLDMLRIKTKGNLSSVEERLLEEGLTSTRMVFVEAVNKSPAKTPSSTPPPAATPAAAGPEAKSNVPPPPEEESHKKFTKKYGA